MIGHYVSGNTIFSQSLDVVFLIPFVYCHLNCDQHRRAKICIDNSMKCKKVFGKTAVWDSVWNYV
jgi:hypothetical protein